MLVRSGLMSILVALVVLVTALTGAPALGHDGSTHEPEAGPAAVATDTPSPVDPPTPPEHCLQLGRWTPCWHADLPPHGAPRTPRSLRRMVREVGGSPGLQAFRSKAPGALIDVDLTGLGGTAGPAAEGLGPTISARGARSAASTAAGTPGVLCLGNGISGNRVQAVYAYSSSSRASQVVPLIRRWAADVETAVRVTANKSNVVRHVRWVHTGDCVLSVLVVKVSQGAVANINRFINDLRAKGLKRADRRYLVWMDGNALCGIGTLLPYDQPGARNPNNGFPVGPAAYSRVDRTCWGLRTSTQESVEAHELFHNLGAVQDSAPNSSKAGHCNDEWDVMCYDDGGPRSTMRVRCSARSDNGLLDCGRNDYFDPRAQPSAYLRNHWNTARSSFLDSGRGAPPTLYGLDATVPTDGVAEPTADVTLKLDVVADLPLARVVLAAARDGSSTFTPVETTRGSITAPVVTLDRGHRWTVSASVVDDRDRQSATLTTSFELARDLPPEVSDLQVSVDGFDGATASVSASWDEDDDTGVASRQVQVSEDNGSTWAGAGGDVSWGSWSGSLARGASYRLRVRVRDDADQWSAWVVSAPFTIAADAPPTVSTPVASIEYQEGGTATVLVDWQAEDDGWIDHQDLLVRVDGAAAALLQGDAWPGSYVEVATGHAYRFIVEVTDNAGQVTRSTGSDELSVPADT